eukprot:7027213-Prymnesium_polylepis.1
MGMRAFPFGLDGPGLQICQFARSVIATCVGAFVLLAMVGSLLTLGSASFGLLSQFSWVLFTLYGLAAYAGYWTCQHQVAWLVFWCLPMLHGLLWLQLVLIGRYGVWPGALWAQFGEHSADRLLMAQLVRRPLGHARARARTHTHTHREPRGRDCASSARPACRRPRGGGGGTHARRPLCHPLRARPHFTPLPRSATPVHAIPSRFPGYQGSIGLLGLPLAALLSYMWLERNYLLLVFHDFSAQLRPEHVKWNLLWCAQSARYLGARFRHRRPLDSRRSSLTRDRRPAQAPRKPRGAARVLVDLPQPARLHRLAALARHATRRAGLLVRQRAAPLVRQAAHGRVDRLGAMARAPLARVVPARVWLQDGLER